MTEFLRADIADQVGGAVGIPVLMAIEAGDPEAGLLATAIRGGIELLLRERRHQEPQPLELFGIQDAVEQLVIVADRHQLTPRHVPQVWSRRQVNRRRKLRQEPIGKVEVEVEAGQIAPRLPAGLVDQELRKNHAALGMIGVR